MTKLVQCIYHLVSAINIVDLIVSIFHNIKKQYQVIELFSTIAKI